MGQIVGGAAKPKRCNLNRLSQLGTPVAGEYILVSSDNSMNAAGQGNFDCYIVGNGRDAATLLELKSVDTLIGVFDISSYHATGGVLAKYADLAAALGTNGANVPDVFRKGGMSVKFVHSSDNKYVQCRYMSSSTATADFTNVNNWQGVDDEPTAGSDNLAKSGGVAKVEAKANGNNFLSSDTYTKVNNGDYHYIGLTILPGDKVHFVIEDSDISSGGGFYITDNNKTPLGLISRVNGQYNYINKTASPITIGYLYIVWGNGTTVKITLSAGSKLIWPILSAESAKIDESKNAKKVFERTSSPSSSIYLGSSLLTETKTYHLSFVLSTDRTFAITLRSGSSYSAKIIQTIAPSKLFEAGLITISFTYESNTATYLRIGENSDWQYITDISIYSDLKDEVFALIDESLILANSSLITYTAGQKIKLSKSQLSYGSLPGGGTGAPEGVNVYKNIVYTPFFLIKADTQLTIHYPTSYTVDGVTYPIGIRGQARDKNNWDAPAIVGTNWSMVFNAYDGQTRVESYTVPSNSKYKYLTIVFTLAGAPNNTDFISAYTNNDIYIQYDNLNVFSQNDVQDTNIVHLDTRLSVVESYLSDNSIFAFNVPLLYDNLMNQLKRRRRVGNTSTESSPRPLLLGHFSDIHGDSENLKRAKDWCDKYSSYLDDVLCTGDLIYSSWNTYGFDFWSECDAGSILTCIGNHDTYDGSDWHAHEGIDAYNRYFAPYISEWGVTQPSDASINGFCYYYKDYSECKVRLIVLDSMAMNTTQLSWLETTLNDVLVNHNDYSVIIAEHHPFTASKCTVIDCQFSSYQAQELPEFGDLSEDVAYKVDNFIEGGGKFICFLQGHTHRDIIYYLTNHKHQLCIVIDCATNKQNNWNDSDRAANTKNQDCLNMIAFDTYSKIVKVVRVGNEWNQQFQRKITLTVRYSEDGSAIPSVLHNN